MAQITSLDELSRLKAELLDKRNREASRGVVYVTVGIGTCGIAVGALDVFHALQDEIKARQLKDIVVSPTGCMGLCRDEPLVEVTLGSKPKVTYGRIDRDKVKRIVQQHLLEGKIVEEFVVDTTLFPTI